VRTIHTGSTSCNDFRSRILAVSQEGLSFKQFATFLLLTTISVFEAKT